MPLYSKLPESVKEVDVIVAGGKLLAAARTHEIVAENLY